MSESTTTTAPATTDAEVIPTTRDTMAAMQWKDAAVVDVRKFDAGLDVAVGLIPQIVDAENTKSALMVRLADAIIAVRLSCTFNGKPDWFGQGGAYRDAFERKLVRKVLAANPDIAEDRITGKSGILVQVRNNYLGESATRAKGMLSDAIVLQAVNDKKIPGATIKDGTVIVRPTVKDKTTGKDVPRTVTVKDADGKVIKDADGKPKTEPVVITYTPGAATVPDILKDPVRQAVKLKKGMKVPTRFGGPAKGTGGDTGDNPPNPAEEYREALAVITAKVGSINALLAARYSHGALTALVDCINQPDTEKTEDIASVLDDMVHLLTIEASILRDKSGDVTLENLDPFRFQEDGDK